MGFGSRNCGHCFGVGTVNKIIFNNILNLFCTVCGKNYKFNLLKIKKKIIYLDQNLFSYASKKIIPPDFLSIVVRLEELTRKQLIICPYSDIHDKETHLIPNEDNLKKLWDFIRKTSRWKRFYCEQKIKEQQLINAYESFILKKQSKKYEINLFEAISSDIHDWDDSMIIETPWSITNFFSKPSDLCESKKKLGETIFKILPEWRSSTSSLKKDYDLEIKDHARLLLSTFNSKDIKKILESEKYGMMCTLINIDAEKMNLTERLHRIINFLISDYFSNIPYVNISAGLWAILKQKVKLKQFLTLNDEKRIKDQVGGVSFDIEHLSLFAPYCDAVFTENKMAGWLREWSEHPLGGYQFKIFSKGNMNEFHSYLDEIESEMTSEMREELTIVEE